MTVRGGGKREMTERERAMRKPRGERKKGNRRDRKRFSSKRRVERGRGGKVSVKVGKRKFLLYAIGGKKVRGEERVFTV